MIDYKSIGVRIKKLRLEKKMTQAQLAEIIGVGTTHVSHIETGNTIPSLEVLVDIINALGCSADELLCNEITADKPILNSWLTELVSDCSTLEIKLISDMVISMKDSIRRLRVEQQQTGTISAATISEDFAFEQSPLFILMTSPDKHRL